MGLYKHGILIIRLKYYYSFLSFIKNTLLHKRWQFQYCMLARFIIVFFRNIRKLKSNQNNTFLLTLLWSDCLLINYYYCSNIYYKINDLSFKNQLMLTLCYILAIKCITRPDLQYYFTANDT